MRAVSPKIIVVATVLLSVLSLNTTEAAQAYVSRDEPKTSSSSSMNSEPAVALLSVRASAESSALVNGVEPQTKTTPFLSQAWCQAERDAWISRIPQLKAKLSKRCVPEVYYWIKEAPKRYSIDPIRFIKTGACESGLDPSAKNGSYLNIFQQRKGKVWQERVRSNNLYGRLDVGGDIYSPRDNILVSAYMMSSPMYGYSHWQCSGLKVKHSGVYS